MNKKQSHAMPRVIIVALIVGLFPPSAFAQEGFGPGERVLLDAHNCYPYQGRWSDRLERALSTGTPVAIEQDMVWYSAPVGTTSRSIVSHGRPYTGEEPSLESYFLETIQPIMQDALRKGNTGDWPLITLNLDIKDNVIEHTSQVFATLKRYEPWITSALKTDDIAQVQPLDVKPLLVLSKGNGSEYQAFYGDVPVGGKLLVFGVARTRGNNASAPDAIAPEPADNFRRWRNHPWALVEEGGQRRAGEWTEADEARLKALVDHSHRMGYWIRFYTLNGHPRRNGMGWSEGYNFGSEDAAALRWRASVEAGVDFIATDMYEAFAASLKQETPATR